MIKKVCGICHHHAKPIWKAKTRDNPCMCKDCYNMEKASQKPPMKARVPIKKISDKQVKINTAYSVLRLQYLKMFPNCGVCGGIANQVHHKVGRIANRTLDTNEWLPVCNFCHHEIEMNPTWAKKNGYSKDRL